MPVVSTKRAEKSDDLVVEAGATVHVVCRKNYLKRAMLNLSLLQLSKGVLVCLLVALISEKTVSSVV